MLNFIYLLDPYRLQKESLLTEELPLSHLRGEGLQEISIVLSLAIIMNGILIP